MFYKCNAFARWYIAKALAACKLAGLKVDAEAFTYYVLSKVLLIPFIPPEEITIDTLDISIYTKSMSFEIPPDVYSKGVKPATSYFIVMQATIRREQKTKYTFTILRFGSYLPNCVYTVAAPKNIQPWLEAGLCNIIERRGYEQYDTPY